MRIVECLLLKVPVHWSAAACAAFCFTQSLHNCDTSQVQNQCQTACAEDVGFLADEMLTSCFLNCLSSIISQIRWLRGLLLLLEVLLTSWSNANEEKIARGAPGAKAALALQALWTAACEFLPVSVFQLPHLFRRCADQSSQMGGCKPMVKCQTCSVANHLGFKPAMQNLCQNELRLF